MQWLEADFAEACDFELIGIGSHLGPHRFCWELNGAFGWSLAFHKLIKVPQRQGYTDHVVYHFHDESAGPDFEVSLIANRLPGGVLARFQGAAQLDYLLRFAEGARAASDWIPRIRDVHAVSYAVELDPLKSGAIEHIALLDLAEMNGPE